MSPEFRAHERSGCFTIAAPCCYCGNESHCFAEDGLTGKDVCRSCCEGDDAIHVDEVDNGDDYDFGGEAYDPGEYDPSDDPRYEGYYDYEDYDYFSEGE